MSGVMKFFIFFMFLLLLYISIALRIAVMHPIHVIVYGIYDGFRYIWFKRWRECKTGKLIAYTALFGKGKTLSAVHYVSSKFRKYDGKLIYDFDRKKWVTQKIYVLSNVDLIGVPYDKLESLSQVFKVAQIQKLRDYANDTLTCTFVLGDEFSVQMNSRSFKDNINALFLNTLLTCRHHHISLVYTAQRFNQVDALLRQVTSFVVECDKVWRFMQHKYYDAYALENATEPALVKSYKNTGFFINNRDYKAYDTLACVDNLQKRFDEKDVLSEEEILALQSNNGANMDAVLTPSRKYRRIRKKMK